MAQCGIAKISIATERQGDELQGKGRVQWCKGLGKWRDVDHGEQSKGKVGYSKGIVQIGYARLWRCEVLQGKAKQRRVKVMHSSAR